MYLNLIKAIYDKPRANIIFSGEGMKPFPLRSRIALEVLPRAIRREKRNKKRLHRKGRSKIVVICR